MIKSLICTLYGMSVERWLYVTRMKISYFMLNNTYLSLAQKELSLHLIWFPLYLVLLQNAGVVILFCWSLV